MQKAKDMRKMRGLSVHALILPAIAIIILLCGMIAFRSARISRVKEQLFATFTAYIDETQTYDAIRKDTTMMSEQAEQYFADFDLSRVEAFCNLARGDSLKSVDDAEITGAWNALVEYETHAVKLFAVGHGDDLTDAKYQTVAAASLTEEENGLSDVEKQTVAAGLLHGEACYILRNRMIDAVDSLQARRWEKTNARLAELSQTMNRYTRAQSIFTAILCIVLLFVIVLLYAMFLLPFNRAMKRVRNGKEIGIHHGLLELKTLSDLYDRLIEKKAMLEDDLRQSAHLDALTGLPNRLAEKQYVSMIRRSKVNLPTAVLSIDVNNLKPTNDTQGHVAGDALLQSAAKCIRKCFGDETNQNCFRIGGDEFVAILRDVTETEVREKIVKFEECQREANISIAVGYAYSDEINPVDVSELFLEADKNMYAAKSEMKRRMATDQLAMPIGVGADTGEGQKALPDTDCKS